MCFKSKSDFQEEIFKQEYYTMGNMKNDVQKWNTIQMEKNSKCDFKLFVHMRLK